MLTDVPSDIEVKKPSTNVTAEKSGTSGQDSSFGIRGVVELAC